MTPPARDALWSSVDRALDEGRDPLEDPSVLEALEREPERLDEVERLLDRIETLRVLPETGRTVLPGPALAAGLAALLLVPALRGPLADRARPADRPLTGRVVGGPAGQDLPATRILELDLEVRSSSGTSLQRWRDGRPTERRLELAPHPHASPAPALGALHLSVVRRADQP